MDSMEGIFGEIFLVSVSHETKHENSSKNFGENSERNSGQNPGHKFEKFGELSFCDFSDLTHRGMALTVMRASWPIAMAFRCESVSPSENASHRNK